MRNKIVLILCFLLVATPCYSAFYTKDSMAWSSLQVMSPIASSAATYHVVVTVDDADRGTDTNYGQTIMWEGNNGMMFLSLNADGYPRVTVLRAGTLWSHCTSAVIATDGQTLAITGVWNKATGLKLFVNGVLMKTLFTDDASLSFNADWDFALGGLKSTAAAPINTFWGTIHEACAWNAALPDDKVESLGKSRVKGTCQQIYQTSPSDLVLDFYLDDYTDGTDLNAKTLLNRAITGVRNLVGYKVTSIISKNDNILSYR